MTRRDPALWMLFRAALGRVEKSVKRSPPGQAAYFRKLHTCLLNAPSREGSVKKPVFRCFFLLSSKFLQIL